MAHSPLCGQLIAHQTRMSQTFHIAVIDTETTGLYPASDRLVEVAVKLLAIDASGQLLEEVAVYESLHDPGIRIPRDAIAVHGITDAMVRGHRIDAARLHSILARADLVIAHNSGFDKGFVRQVVPESFSMNWGCSCRGIPWRTIYPQVFSASLPSLAAFLKLPTGKAHRALGDVETTVNLLLHVGPNGRPHVAHLLDRKLGVQHTMVVQVPVTAKGARAPFAIAAPSKAPSATSTSETVPFVQVAQKAAPDTVESAAEFALQLLRTNPDYEMSVDDIHDEGEAKWSKRNISAGLMRLLDRGHVTEKTDPDQSVWWTISA